MAPIDRTQRNADEPAFTPVVALLPEARPFIGPEALERARGRPFRARLGANESVFGPAPQVVTAIAEAASEAWAYGDPEAHDLRQALAALTGAAPERITVGAGVDGLLGVAARLFAGPGDAVVTSLGGYPTFSYHVAGLGARLVSAPYRDDREDLEALAAAARAQDARIVYVANPDNPMGTVWPAEAVRALRDALPPRCVLFLDEAYIEFAPEGTAPAFAPDDAGVIRFRTFSKAYGLAGLRVGYAVAAPALSRGFDKLRNHFGVGRVAQAGALAALRAQDWLTRTAHRVAAGRARLAEIAEANGLSAVPSAANFVAIDCGGDSAFARRVLEEVLARNVFIRMPGAAPLDRCIRVSVGAAQDLDLFAEILPQALAAAASSRTRNAG